MSLIIHRFIIHRFICWYLRKVEGTFHTYHYGNSGRYVVLMTEEQYARYMRYSEKKLDGRA